MMGFLQDNWTCIVAVLAALGGILYTAWYRFNEGDLHGRARTLREIYGPKEVKRL